MRSTSMFKCMYIINMYNVSNMMIPEFIRINSLFHRNVNDTNDTKIRFYFKILNLRPVICIQDVVNPTDQVCAL